MVFEALNDKNSFEALRKLSSSSLDWELLEILLAGIDFRRSTTSVGIRARSLRRSMYCRRSAVDDVRSRRSRAVDEDRRRIRWADDEDRHRRRWACDDYRRRRRREIDDYPPLELPLQWRDPPPVYPSPSYSAARKGIRNQPIVVDDYPPLELPLQWRDPPPEYPPLELPLKWGDPPPLQRQIRDSRQFQHSNRAPPPPVDLAIPASAAVLAMPAAADQVPVYPDLSRPVRARTDSDSYPYSPADGDTDQTVSASEPGDDRDSIPDETIVQISHIPPDLAHSAYLDSDLELTAAADQAHADQIPATPAADQASADQTPAHPASESPTRRVRELDLSQPDSSFAACSDSVEGDRFAGHPLPPERKNQAYRPPECSQVCDQSPNRVATHSRARPDTPLWLFHTFFGTLAYVAQEALSRKGKLLFRLMDTNSQTRITIPEIMENLWFKKGFLRIRFYIENDKLHNIDEIDEAPPTNALETPSSEKHEETSDSGCHSNGSAATCPAAMSISRGEIMGLPRPTSLNASELDDYAEKAYLGFKDGNHLILNHDSTRRSPLCAGKKKQDYQFKDLLQHAIGRGSSTSRKAKEKANHLGLARFLQKDLALAVGLVVSPPHIQVDSDFSHLRLHSPPASLASAYSIQQIKLIQQKWGC
ncbi:hypothetical protein KFK09_021844 [Dendrobium nobile]|uniref:Zinc finger-XS domain-containing protein n=1 Tax=Dendrobium nobile TaxID=94219 RepID=A0A8T3AH88_DENNO|nr:hypothetical protein KFK09_021844 [Dendrobium nobile]